jgi:DNA/RNA-binding domain of Phe-tRNA-synthetase-like protein
MEQTPTLGIDPAIDPLPFRAALIWGFGMPGCPATAAPPPFLDEIVERARAGGAEFVSAARKAAVRAMLRHGSYKPAGRSKPSSEYLLAAALAGEFPTVNGPVDVNNGISMECGFPASIFDADLSGLDLFLRRGRQGESYEFNRSRQTIALEDLLCVCRKVNGEWMPCGNPVKDCVATKVTASTTRIVAVIFAPSDESEIVLSAAAERYAGLLSSECGARQAGSAVVSR